MEPTRVLCPWDFPGKNRGKLPFHSLGDLPYPGIEPQSPALQADSLLLSHQGSPEGLFAQIQTLQDTGHKQHGFRA